jgi:excisionase family DNA binding protein
MGMPNDDAPPENLVFLTVDEVAKKLRMSPKTVRRHCKHREIPSEKLGNRYLIPASFIDRIIERGNPDSDATRRRK